MKERTRLKQLQEMGWGENEIFELLGEIINIKEGEEKDKNTQKKESLDEKIIGLVKDIGIPYNLIGRKYIIQGIKYCMDYEECKMYNDLYPYLAEVFDTKPSRIARAIRSSICCHTNDIIFIEARERKITVYTINGSYLSIHPMNYWIDKLIGLSFFQTHKSFLINLKYVCHFNHDTVYLCDNQFQAYLTRRKYTLFKNTYLLYLDSTK